MPLVARRGRRDVVRSCVYGALFAPLCHMLANVDDWHGMPFAVAAVAGALLAMFGAKLVASDGTLDRRAIVAIVVSAAVATALLAGLDSITIGHALGALLAWTISCAFAGASLAIAVVTGVRCIVRAIVACILALVARAGGTAPSRVARRDPDRHRASLIHLRSRGFRAPPSTLRLSLT